MIVVIYIVLRQPPVCAGEPVIIAKRVHPFPSRTRSLSSSAPMILWGQPHGKIGHRRFTRPHRRFSYSPLSSVFKQIGTSQPATRRVAGWLVPICLNTLAFSPHIWYTF